MTQHFETPDIIDDGASDVLAEDEVVHVPPAAAELAESLEHHNDSTFEADVPDWDEPDPQP
jgi:hypothetical protein